MKPYLRRTVLTFVVSALALAASPLRAEAEAKAKEEIPPSVLKRYDKNKNGTLEETEVAKWEADKAAAREKKRAERAAMLEKFDTDKDGKLSAEERAEAKLAMQEENTAREAERLKARAEKQKAEREAKLAEPAKEKPAQAAGEGMTMEGEKMMAE